MTEDRDQLSSDVAEDRATLERSTGQGTGGTGYDRLPGQEAEADEAAPDVAELS